MVPDGGTEQTDTWWTITDDNPCPCCDLGIVVTNGDAAECDNCGWTGNYEDIDTETTATKDTGTQREES